MSNTSLEWINTRKPEMIEQLTEWANNNSGSDNHIGLARMLAMLEKSFSSLNGKIERLSLLPRKTISSSGEVIITQHGEALRITKRPHAPMQIFLGGHMDTVYQLSHPFQTVFRPEENILRGPGVADMKGGLLIMLTALQFLEQHPSATNIGWEVLINPDEEIGSLGSESLLKKAAKRHQFGLIFEPSFADGAIVSSRKGSINFSVIARGRAAHAGRDFDKGRNAILAIADYISHACNLNNQEKGISINPGYIQGGGPVNIVPDLAICRLNARAIHPVDFVKMKKDLPALIENNIEGLEVSYFLETNRGPKIFDEKCRHLFDLIETCAKEEGYSLTQRPSGGVCDGNILAEEGLPVIDTLGAIGGNIHTENEYILIDSLVSRSRLVSLLLINLAKGKLKLKI